MHVTVSRSSCASSFCLLLIHRDCAPLPTSTAAIMRSEFRPHTRIFLTYTDATDASNWAATVGSRAESLAAAFLKGERLPVPDTFSTLSPSLRQQLSRIREKKARLNIGSDGGEWRKYECDACGRVLNGEHEWKVHLASRSHKKRAGRKKIYEEYLQRKQQEEEAEQSGSALPVAAGERETDVASCSPKRQRLDRDDVT